MTNIAGFALSLVDSSGRTECQPFYHEGRYYSAFVYCFVKGYDEDGRAAIVDKNKLKDSISLVNFATGRPFSESVECSVVDVFEAPDYEYSNKLIVSFKLESKWRTSITVPIGVKVSYIYNRDSILWYGSSGDPLYLKA
ncbi:hypothetical protein ACI2JN_10030 [Ochrobactrum teleogrylli]|uniref:Uncharacterized protein n=2 Tax=Ochrobactrum TaxID=528 RepID=A0ABD5K0Y4_9HYPH|nr:hypothetical protein [[Ochrobactrum] soli]NNU63252.1 hypothetical protein [[Ochrobactrum] soli]